MKFLYPEFLWALTVLAIPIIIHLFNFKRYKTLYFSSLNFIKHVDQKTKSTQRLKHLLVLLMSLLAFTFLALAFAHRSPPFLSPTLVGIMVRIPKDGSGEKRKGALSWKGSEEGAGGPKPKTPPPEAKGGDHP